MALDAGVAKPFVDALLRALQLAKTEKLKGNARRALSDAVRELLTITPDLGKADAAVAAAKAAGIIDERIFLIESMRSRVRKHRKASRRRTTTRRKARSSGGRRARRG